MTEPSAKVVKKLSAEMRRMLESSEAEEQLKLAALVDVLNSLVKVPEDNSEGSPASNLSTVETEEVK